ncbi:MAG TPA: GH25 family lysozyme, partial [Chitinophagaceae bacterium]
MAGNVLFVYSAITAFIFAPTQFMASKKKKKIRRRVMYIVAGALIMLVAYLGYKWWLFARARFVRYPEFGISIPEEYSIHGIDVSRYQDMIAWDVVSAMQVRKIRLGFAFIKATEGVTSVDPQFRRNWKKSKDAGIIRGAYHFFIPTRDGRSQAQNFIRN